jgi:NADH dehydrogenase FAD-containing subunit
VVLGTGWGGTTFLRNLDSRLYDVQVISPRNYFAFTPLLPSVTSGTVEPRSIVEPIRRVLEKVCCFAEFLGSFTVMLALPLCLLLSSIFQ